MAEVLLGHLYGLLLAGCGAGVLKPAPEGASADAASPLVHPPDASVEFALGRKCVLNL